MKTIKPTDHQRIREAFAELGTQATRQRTILQGITHGRTQEISELNEAEIEAVMSFLAVRLEIVRQRRDRLRKTLLSQGYSIGWKKEKTIEWVEKHGSGKKPINTYTEAELMKMIKILERIQIKYGVGKEMNYHSLNLN